MGVLFVPDNSKSDEQTHMFLQAGHMEKTGRLCETKEMVSKRTGGTYHIVSQANVDKPRKVKKIL